MYDDLRDLSDPGDYFEEEEEEAFEEYKPSIPQTPVLGMTAGQRLLISILLLATVAVVGMMFLLVFTKVWIF